MTGLFFFENGYQPRAVKYFLKKSSLVDVRPGSKNASVSSRKMSFPGQASNEQVDAQSSPRVSRKMLPILNMPIHCHT